MTLIETKEIPNINLQVLLERGILSEEVLEEISETIKLEERKSILDKMPKPVKWSDGRYHVNFFDDGVRVQKASVYIERVEEFLINYYNQKKRVTVKDCFDTFCERKNFLSPSSLEKYQQCYNRFLKPWSNKPIEMITYPDMEKICVDAVVGGATKKYFNNLATVLNGIFDAADDMHNLFVIDSRRALSKIRRIIGHNFIDSVVEINPVDKSESVFYDTEAKTLIAECIKNDTLVDLGIALLFFSGLREGELAVLRKESISEDHRIIHVKASETRANNQYLEGLPKWKKIRNVYLPDCAIPIVDRLFQLSDPKSEFLFSEEGYTYSWYRTKKFCDRLKTLERRLEMVARSPHDIRRTYDSTLEKGGVPVALRLSLMGHSSKGIDAHYIRDNSTTEEKIEYLNKAFSAIV